MNTPAQQAVIDAMLAKGRTLSEVGAVILEMRMADAAERNRRTRTCNGRDDCPSVEHLPVCVKYDGEPWPS